MFGCCIHFYCYELAVDILFFYRIIHFFFFTDMTALCIVKKEACDLLCVAKFPQYTVYLLSLCIF